MASAGCMKCAGVPVLDSVAAIFWQMMPDLPMPVRMTRPLHWRSSSTARSKRSSRRSTSARIAAASVCRTFLGRARSAMGAGSRRLLDDGVDGEEAAEQGLEQVEPQGVLRVALGRRGIVVDFQEHAVH